MYPYHNLNKKRIMAGELVGYEFVGSYKHIGECLLLHFDSPPFDRPVRPHRYAEYFHLLEEWEARRAGDEKDSV